MPFRRPRFNAETVPRGAVFRVRSRCPGSIPPTSALKLAFHVCPKGYVEATGGCAQAVGGYHLAAVAAELTRWQGAPEGAAPRRT